MTSSEERLLYRIALSRFKGLTLEAAGVLLSKAGSEESLFQNHPARWNEWIGVNRPLFTQEKRENALEWAKREYDFVQAKGITPLFFTDPNYPKRLLECIDAPLFLYYKGNADLNTKRIITVVGTRHATAYGKGFCERFVQELAQRIPDLLLISGLAYGVDVTAHRAAQANQLSTVGVLAHGLHTIYPKVHRSIACEMIKNGGLLTEYGSQDLLHKGCFVARNRIVAGLSDATLIIESPQKGGSLITARLAADYHRDVFALPGRVGDTQSEGCNRLIARNEAGLLASAEQFILDMLWEEASHSPKKNPDLPLLSEPESLVMQLLSQETELHIDSIAAYCEIAVSEAMVLLLGMEFKGLVRAMPGGCYRK